MSCCRGTRAPAAPTVASPRHVPSIVYRYEGTTALTVIGRATNRRYHFAAPGAELAVDWRDTASVAQVPSLREIWRG
jgi:hypothetical protein